MLLFIIIYITILIRLHINNIQIYVDKHNNPCYNTYNGNRNIHKCQRGFFTHLTSKQYINKQIK